MTKKLFYSTVCLLTATLTGFCTDYKFQTSLGNLNDVSNWKDGSNTSPVDFSSSGDTWDLNGFSGQLSADLIISGTVTNSGVPSNIEINSWALTFAGSVTVNQISISNIIPNGTVIYSNSTDGDVIPGTYNNIELSGIGKKTATGDLTIEGNLTTSGSSNITLDMNEWDLIDGGSFTIGTLGTGTFEIQTQSTSATPIPVYTWPTGTKIVFNGMGLPQYIPSGSYDQLTLSNAGYRKIIASGDAVTVRTVFDNSSHLVLEADASGYGQFHSLVANTSVSPDDRIVKQYYIDVTGGAQYFQRGTTLDGANLNEFKTDGSIIFSGTNTGSVWKWDAGSSEWVQPSPTVNAASEAYTIYAGSAAGVNFVTSQATDIVELEAEDYHWQDVNATLHYDNTGDSSLFVDKVIDGWNFVANPFLGNYDFDGHDLTDGSTGTMANYYYILNGSNYNFYQVSGTGGSGGSAGTSGTSQYIAPGQGVWFRTGGSWNGDTKFEATNVDMTGTSQMYKSTSATNDLLRITVSEVNGTNADEVLIKFDPNTTDAEDFSIDVPKKSNLGNVPSTYVKLGNATYALCVTNASRKSFPLHFKDIDHGQQMEYSITENSLTSYGSVFIEDKKNNSFTEITNANYTFTNDTAYGEDRFVIHFEKGVGLPEGMIPDAASYDAFYSNGSINFTFQENNFTPTGGGLYTLQGKLISKFELNEANTSISVPNVPTGIYLISLDNDTAGARKLYINK